MNIPGLLLYTFFIINSYTYYKIDKKNTLSCELKNKYFIVKELKIMIFFQRLPLSQVKGFLEYIHTCSVMHLGSLQMMRVTRFNILLSTERHYSFDLHVIYLSYVCSFQCTQLCFNMSAIAFLKPTNWKTSWRSFRSIPHNLEGRVFLFFWPAVNFLPQWHGLWCSIKDPSFHSRLYWLCKLTLIKLLGRKSQM